MGSKQQRDNMKVPIYRIKSTKKQWILWQIDIGIYDDLAVVKQIVKGMLTKVADKNLYIKFMMQSGEL